MGTTLVMDLYVTSKNSGPSWTSESKYMVYIGESLEDAIAAVPENFQRYVTDLARTKAYPSVYTVLPQTADFDIVRFYSADGWWYSIAKMEFG